MGKNRTRYCIRVKDSAWQIWDRKMGKWWGKPTKDFPYEVLNKLNTGKRSELKY